MTNKYFTFCKTAEDCKQLYKRLCKKLHPDCNPGRDTTKEFQEMQAEFERAFNRLKSIHVNAAGETYEKETTETAAEFMDMVAALLRIDGINVELCGSWFWITGNTKEHKEELKALGFKWSSKKCAWYYHREPWHKKGGNCTLDEIRRKYGSVKFGRETAADAERITA